MVFLTIIIDFNYAYYLWFFMSHSVSMYDPAARRTTVSSSSSSASTSSSGGVQSRGSAPFPAIFIPVLPLGDLPRLPPGFCYRLDLPPPPLASRVQGQAPYMNMRPPELPPPDSRGVVNPQTFLPLPLPNNIIALPPDWSPPSDKHFWNEMQKYSSRGNCTYFIKCFQELTIECISGFFHLLITDIPAQFPACRVDNGAEASRLVFYQTLHSKLERADVKLQPKDFGRRIDDCIQKILQQILKKYDPFILRSVTYYLSAFANLSDNAKGFLFKILQNPQGVLDCVKAGKICISSAQDHNLLALTYVILGNYEKVLDLYLEYKPLFGTSVEGNFDVEILRFAFANSTPEKRSRFCEKYVSRIDPFVGDIIDAAHRADEEREAAYKAAQQAVLEAVSLDQFSKALDDLEHIKSLKGDFYYRVTLRLIINQLNQAAKDVRGTGVEERKHKICRLFFYGLKAIDQPEGEKKQKKLVKLTNRVGRLFLGETQSSVCVKYLSKLNDYSLPLKKCLFYVLFGDLSAAQECYEEVIADGEWDIADKRKCFAEAFNLFLLYYIVQGKYADGLKFYENNFSTVSASDLIDSSLVEILRGSKEFVDGFSEEVVRLHTTIGIEHWDRAGVKW